MAAAVTLNEVRKSYEGGIEVIKGVNLDIRKGEFMVFVGPSGCGKSTMMRMIAGLEDVTDGTIAIGDVVANDLAPVERGVAMVFQSYALYPHMTVAENMSFGLRMLKRPKAEIDAAVGHAAEILQINHLLDRRPKALSGGQRQRVAIGRAIVRKPKVFLFDEPLSNLDAGLRVQMRVELTRLHRELGATMIYVTHDQTEAMTMGDRIAVFDRGVVQQVGTPMDVYRQPCNTFVAQFLGSPRMNIVQARIHQQGQAWVLYAEGLGDVEVPAPADPSVIDRVTQVGIRPESLMTGAEGWGLSITLIEHLGDTTLIYGGPLRSEAPLAVKLAASDPDWRVGDLMHVQPKPGHTILFDADGHNVGVI